jgi:hypothetical protein
MLAYLRERGGATERKLRLFAVACCRRVWNLLPEDSQAAVEVAEQFADGFVKAEEMRRARGRAVGASLRGGPRSWRDIGHGAGVAEQAAWWANMDVELMPRMAARCAANLPPWQACRAERQAQAVSLRDIFGNPFCPAPALAPSVLAWGGGTVPKLAAAIYEERAFDRLPVLADALEDAGCTEPAILELHGFKA